MSTGFAKTLLNREVLALSCGAMIGWSWVLLTGEWLARAGTLGTLVAFVIGSGIVLLISLTYAELAAAMPLTGGEHHYTKRALGYTASFVASWAVVVAYVTVCVFESAALPTALEYLFPNLAVGLLWEVADSPVYLSMVLIGALATALMTYINYLGIRFAAFVQTVITVLFITVGVLFFFGVSLHPSPEPAVPQWTNGIPGILSVLVMVPALMVGFDVIPQSAEEINLPPNRIGRLLVLSVGLAGAWYIAISLAVGSALTFDGLGASTMPTADAMAAVWGSSLMGQIMLLAGVGGILTSWNAFIIGGSRILYALSASGMIPRVFSRLHPKYQTPYVSILTIGALSLLSPLFGRAVLVWLVDAGSFAIVVAYLLVVVSFLKLRRAEPSMPRPFRVPLGNFVGALALILTFCLLLLYLPGSPAALLWPEEWLMLLVSAAVGAVFYWRGPARRQAAQTAK